MASADSFHELTDAVLGRLTFTPCALEVVTECASTNELLLARAAQGAPSGSVLVALSQTAGRGRLGRPWYAPAGSSLSFSLLYRFAASVSPMGLPLAVGCACAVALNDLGVPAALKWPNDLLLGERKLGGILIELAGAGNVVIGIGLNLHRPTKLPDAISETAVFLDDGPTVPPLPVLLSGVLNELGAMLPFFAAEGFAAFRETWLKYAVWLGQPVMILDGARQQNGVMAGIDQDGALLLAGEEGMTRILAGDVSLRRA